MLKTIGPHFDRQEILWGNLPEGGYGNETVVDRVPPEMMHMIEPIWYLYPPMESIWYKWLGITMCLLTILALTGNGLVLYIFTCTKSLRTPSNLLVVNLALSDFCMMCSMGPAMAWSCLYETWMFGPFGCELYAMAGSIFGNASIWTMVFIALDRYNVIVKGLAAKPMTIKLALFKILLIYTHAIMWSIAPILGWSRFVPEMNMTSCGTDYLNESIQSKSFIVIYALFVYVTPLLVIIYSYYFIVKAIAKHEKTMREQAKKMNVTSLRSGEQSNTSAEIKLAKVALMTISLWFMAWTPYLVINFGAIFDLITIDPLFTIWGAVFAKANAVYNPIVYAISHPKYRQALDKNFPCLVCGKLEDDKSDTKSIASAQTTVSEDKV
ncbi:opsin-1-like [Daktulosphaira vitifoliae]|uniref:opsin-1-like n=1 Tax=Daktulosphaira vitifoliae TaxID=58002 RepID=UPI0021AB0273|nr:opsin-1-like [Daktulosphaira vitifoliae]